MGLDDGEREDGLDVDGAEDGIHLLVKRKSDKNVWLLR